jgi:hypothetical protein
MQFKLKCPRTVTSFSTFVQIDGQVVARYWGKNMELICPLCASVHAFDFKQHYIAAAIEAGHVEAPPTAPS